MNALLAVNGEIDAGVFRQLSISRFGLVVATDGAADRLKELGIEADYIVGDLDSVSENTRKAVGPERLIFRPSQELNDLEKALMFCAEKEVRRITLVGVTGKRFDHSLNNFSVLCRYYRKFELEIVDQYARYFLVNESFSYSGTVGQTVSLLPLGIVEGITTNGLGFPLKNEPLEIGVREGCSNVMTEKQFSVQVASGVLLVAISWDNQ
ncbi:MAG: thiamine diphosphokinase [Calditrichia bacterium]